MNDWLKTLFHTDHYTSRVRQEQAYLMYLVATLLLITEIFVFFLITTQSILIENQNMALFANSAVMVSCLITIGFVRSGWYTYGAWLLNIIAVLALFTTALENSVDPDTLIVVMFFIVLMSALTLNTIGLITFGSILTVFYLVELSLDFLPIENPFSLRGFGTFIALEMLVYAFLRFTEISRTEGIDSGGQERFKLAEINTQITRQASERMSLDDALNATLEVILENYPQFYHAQVFLIDEDGIQARLRASSREIGRSLLERGHSLAVGSLSVIGQCTFKGTPVIALASAENTVHRENQLLQQTQLEAAFPLRIGEKIIGALDLQSANNEMLSEYDQRSFQSLADSLSLAIDNIQQFEAAKSRVEENQRLAEQARTALREIERLNQRLIGRAWSEYLSGRNTELGFDVDLEGQHTELDIAWTPTLSNAAQSNAIVQEENIIAVPLRVRGTVIGAIEFELGPEGQFSPAEMELVQEVSDRFGLAVENTRLVEESQRIAQREALINEISSRLQSANNVETTLSEAARSMKETLHAEKVTIRLGIPGASKQS